MPSCHGFLVPFPLKQLFSPHPLGILPVADLQPGCAWQVRINFSLCNYTFEIALADKMEQLLTHALNVIAVQQPFTVRWDQALGTHRPSAAYAPRMQRIRLPWLSSCAHELQHMVRVFYLAIAWWNFTPISTFLGGGARCLVRCALCVWCAVSSPESKVAVFCASLQADLCRSLCTAW